jgi:transcriptional regulator with GAF, ATPase, and Fis domain
VNISVKRDEKIAKAGQLELVEDYKVIILWASLNPFWPGNVRELQNIIERALITSQGRPLTFLNLATLPSETPDEGTPYGPGRFLKMNEMIALHIRRSLSLSKGRIAGRGGAAEILGMHPSTLRARMRKLGIRVNRLPS